MTSQPRTASDAAVLKQAADWLVLLQSGDATEDDRKNLAYWRAGNPAHEIAWQRAEEVLATFRRVPPALGRETLTRLRNPGRRQLLRGIGALLIAAPAGYLTWRLTRIDDRTVALRTVIGERKDVRLDDGTRLMLNTDTTVGVLFNSTERLVMLHIGEILIETAQDTSRPPRPFLVQTGHGRMRALGTRFSVRCLDDSTRIVVEEGAVEIHPADSPITRVVRAGEQTTFASGGLQPLREATAGALLWERGMLLAQGMSLEQLAGELERYHAGPLDCDPAVANLKVSGAFPVADINASLSLLEKTLPVRVRRISSHHVAIQPL